MEIPDPIRKRLGDESLESAVNLGDEDLICFSPTRTFIYHGEGLISDESVDVYDHDIERLAVSEGRRKTTFTLTYVDREERFKIPQGRTDAVLERLLAGVMYVADVIEAEESVEGVFRFSELTLILTDKRVIKRVGRYVWDEDFEEYPFANVTGLEFEEGSVATQVVISVDGRPQRIKAPSEDARLVEHTLKQALFEYYDVESLTALNDLLGDGEPEPTDDDSSGSAGLQLDDTISPLVGDDDEAVDTVEGPEDLQIEAGSDGADGTSAGAAAEPEADTANPSPESTESTDSPADGSGSVTETESTADSEMATPAATGAAVDGAVDPEEIEAMKSRLVTLTKVVKRQNKLLKEQHETIDQLIEELQREK